MKTSIKYIFASLVFCFILLNCSSSSDDDEPDPGNGGDVNPPSAAILVFPNENSECTEGSNLTSNESTIVFDWNDSNNTDSYQLFVKNLETQNTTNYTSSTSEKSVTILRGTPYSWYVVSKNSGTETAQSQTWKFYNAGEAVSSYAPFPADIGAPAFGTSLSSATTSVTLQWTGEDVDNDIESYQVLFDTTTPPTAEVQNNSSNSAEVTVSSGNTYYWRVVTKDTQGNASQSTIYEFKVD